MVTTSSQVSKENLILLVSETLAIKFYLRNRWEEKTYCENSSNSCSRWHKDNSVWLWHFSWYPINITTRSSDSIVSEVVPQWCVDFHYDEQLILSNGDPLPLHLYCMYTYCIMSIIVFSSWNELSVNWKHTEVFIII